MEYSCLRELFETIDSMDAKGFVEYLCDDAVFRFSNRARVCGKDNIINSVEEFFSSIKGLKHRLDTTLFEGSSVMCNGEVTYTRKDDSEITLPFANVMKLQGEKVKEYLIYIEIAPLFA